MCIFAKENNVLTNKRQTAIPLHPKRWSFLAEIYMTDITQILNNNLTYKQIMRQLKICGIYTCYFKRWLKYNMADDIPKTITSIVSGNINQIISKLTNNPFETLRIVNRNADTTILIRKGLFGKYNIKILDYYTENEIKYKLNVNINQLISILIIYIVLYMFDYIFSEKSRMYIEDMLFKQKKFAINIF